jgi:hypothetical protein
MNELLYKEEVFQLASFCMEIHRELGKGHDEITYKGVVLPHYYYADFVVWDKILFEAKAVEKLTDSHIKQVLNYLAGLETSARSVGQFRWRFARVEKGCFMRHKFCRDTNCTN